MVGVIVAFTTVAGLTCGRRMDPASGLIRRTNGRFGMEGTEGELDMLAVDSFSLLPRSGVSVTELTSGESGWSLWASGGDTTEQGLISASAVAGELRVGVTTGGFTDSSRDESMMDGELVVEAGEFEDYSARETA